MNKNGDLFVLLTGRKTSAWLVLMLSTINRFLGKLIAVSFREDKSGYLLLTWLLETLIGCVELGLAGLSLRPGGRPNKHTSTS